MGHRVHLLQGMGILGAGFHFMFWFRTLARDGLQVARLFRCALLLAWRDSCPRGVGALEPLMEPSSRHPSRNVDRAHRMGLLPSLGHEEDQQHAG